MDWEDGDIGRQVESSATSINKSGCAGIVLGACGLGEQVDAEIHMSAIDKGVSGFDDRCCYILLNSIDLGDITLQRTFITETDLASSNKDCQS